MIATESILIEELKKHFKNNTSGIFPDEQRQVAWAAFEKSGMPTRKTEEYRYIPITRLLEKNFDASLTPNSGSSVLSEESIKKHYIKDAEGYRLVIVNGQLIRHLSDIPDSIQLTNIADVESTEVKNNIGKHVKVEDDPFVALNTALTSNGFAFCISRNKVLDKPLYIYNITDSTSSQVHQQARNIIVLEENSQAKVVMVNKGHGEKAAFINEVTEVVMAQNAHLQWTRLEDEPEKCFHINNTKVYQEKDAHFEAVSISVAGGLIRNNLHVALDGEGCQADLYGLYLTSKDDIVDNHTVVDHRKPNSNSNELYKGILFDRARGVFNGKIYVRPDAQKTNAFQSNNNILLSTDATVNSKPQLEIWADDVKCSHGCTTGQLDEEAIFYLQARGISKQMAKAFLLQAFADEVIEHIKLPDVKAYIKGYVNDKLGV